MEEAARLTRSYHRVLQRLQRYEAVLALYKHNLDRAEDKAAFWTHLREKRFRRIINMFGRNFLFARVFRTMFGIKLPHETQTLMRRFERPGMLLEELYQKHDLMARMQQVAQVRQAGALLNAVVASH